MSVFQVITHLGNIEKWPFEGENYGKSLTKNMACDIQEMISDGDKVFVKKINESPIASLALKVEVLSGMSVTQAAGDAIKMCASFNCPISLIFDRGEILVIRDTTVEEIEKEFKEL